MEKKGNGDAAGWSGAPRWGHGWIVGRVQSTAAVGAWLGATKREAAAWVGVCEPRRRDGRQGKGGGVRRAWGRAEWWGYRPLADRPLS